LVNLDDSISGSRKYIKRELGLKVWKEKKMNKERIVSMTAILTNN
jgi:hypothetical protein